MAIPVQSQSQLRALLFDVDGTLVDSNEAHIRSWLEAFAHYGKYFDYEVIRQQMGKGGDLLVPDLLQAREMRKFGKELQTYRSKLYRKNYLPGVKPFGRIKECFELLRALDITIVLASSSDPEEVEYYTQLLGVGDLVAGSTSKGDVELSKPSPEIFRTALERAGSDDERTFAVGDTPYDILSSHRVPLPVAAVLSGGFERELLGKAELLFTDVADLVGNLQRFDDYFDQD